MMFGDKWHKLFSPATSLKETECSDPDQWPGLILSSSTTGLLMEGVWPLTPPLWPKYRVWHWNMISLGIKCRTLAGEQFTFILL